MIKIFVRVLLFLRRFYRHYSRIFGLFKGFSSRSFCEDKDSIKPFYTKVIDYLYLFFVLKIFPRNYHLFRMDCRDRSSFRNYLDDPDSPYLKDKFFDVLWPRSYIFLIHDKYIFHCMCKFHGIPTPKIYGLYGKGRLRDCRSLVEFMEMERLEKVVLKPVLGLMGEDIYVISRTELRSRGNIGEAKIEVQSERIEGKDLIVQEFVNQHNAMDEINPHSINTIRLISIICKDGSVNFLAGMLRTSANTTPVDNFSKGGIVVGIDLGTGRLERRGFRKPGYGFPVTAHPVTKTCFEGYQIPFWEEVLMLAAKAQRTFYQIRSIGWDIAITPKGPIIIEGNQQWGTASIQAANGGLLTPKNRALLAQYGLEFP